MKPPIRAPTPVGTTMATARPPAPVAGGAASTGSPYQPGTGNGSPATANSAVTDPTSGRAIVPQRSTDNPSASSCAARPATLPTSPRSGSTVTDS
jgi:hypothetical protein